MNTTELIAQIRADIAARIAMPDFGPETSIERIKTINATQRSFTPETVEALVEALESAQHESAVNWEAATSLDEENEELKRRIAELEGQAIKFPPKVERDDSDGYWMLKGQRVSAANAAYYNEALKDVALALFAAGIKCEVKGE